MFSRKTAPSKLLFALFLASSISFSFSNDTVMLEEVVVTDRIKNAKKEISSSKITSSHINDQKDLVKNYVGIGSVDGGRSGSNGFAIRGVDRNRVSIKVDGVEASQSFNPTFFQKQGRMSGSRSLVEFENLSYLKIDQGSNSLEYGNGALGGVVSMKTKTPSDFIMDGKNVGFYSKTGYASKNREFKQVLGAGFMVDGFEGLFQYTRRKGHETDTWYGYDETFVLQDYRVSNEFRKATDSGVHNEISKLIGYTRIYPDPLTYSSNAYLFKLGYRFNDEHFLNFFYDEKDIKNDIKNYSTHATGSNKFQKDTTPYKRGGIIYEYTPNKVLEFLSLQFLKQEVKQIYQSDTLELQWLNSGYKVPHVKEYSQNTQDTTQFDFKANTIDLEFMNTYHSFYAGGGYTKHKFKNSSFYGNNYGDSFSYTLTKPIHTDVFYLYLGDYAQISDKLSLNLGLRYDKHKVNPKDSSLPNYSKKFDFPGVEKKSYDALTYLFEVNYELMPNVDLGYKFSTAFRMPSIQEAYVTDLTSFGMPYWANPNLDPEESRSNEISISLEDDYFAFDIAAFHTKYKNYIDLNEFTAFYGMKEGFDWQIGDFVKKPIYKKTLQYQNSSSATIKGIEINSILRGEMFNLDGFFIRFKLAYQDGKKKDGTSLLAMQPLTTLVGLGYENSKFSILLDARYQKAKSKNDTKYKFIDNSKNGTSFIETYPYLSSSYVVWDLTTSWNISDNLKVNFGVFNIFNKKYTTWDTIRESKENGTLTITTADNGNVMGWERLTSPGRNFSASFELKF